MTPDPRRAPLAARLLAAGCLLAGPAAAEPPAEPAADAEPTLQIEGFTAHVTGEDGRPTHRLQGSRLREYDRDAVQFIDDPELDLLDQRGLNWTWRAPRAAHQPDRELLHTFGHTRGVRPERDERVRTVIESRDVRVALDTRLTTSSAPSTLEQPGLFQRGTGLRADPQADTIGLLAEVYTLYSDLPQEDRPE
ncbi:LPS export ABC transporter periplasmic protein LptC [Thioalkalivibrio sp. ALE11]|uniref:LPS export ABC transporter periplasmic protein LptC n=1 Tax=Thioalkalivibrio sp. ALE11 TaxID=1265494 RepID=UPI00037AA10F|nr:LPS export ABC transporter periplasmic protein LptC [Thioalkalivibrio sp. ALE11]